MIRVYTYDKVGQQDFLMSWESDGKEKKKRSNRLFDVWGLSNWKIKFLLTDKKTVEKYVWVGLEGRQCGAYLI